MSLFNPKPISQWPPGFEVQSTDYYIATDIQDLSASPSGTTKKYSIGQLQTFLTDNLNANNLNTAIVASISNLSASYINGDSGIDATLTSLSNESLVIGGVDLEVGNRVVVTAQSSSFENGVYAVTDSGSVSTRWIMKRAADFNGSPDGRITQGDYLGVLFGSSTALSWWFLTSDSNPVIGTDSIVFQKQSDVSGDNWLVATSIPTQMAINTGYTSSAGTTLIEFALPTTAAPGDWVEINGEGSGLFNVIQSSGQQIFSGSASTTLGESGFISSNLQYTSLKLRCIVENVTFEVCNMEGSITFN